MRIALIYSDKLCSETIATSRRIEGVREIASSFQIEIVSPDVDAHEYLLTFHSKEYVEKVRSLPFYDVAVESIRCIAKAADMIREFDVLIVPTSATGHLAERDRMRGYCVFNDLAILVEKLKERWRRIAVIESDAHHGSTLAESRVQLFCIGKRKCEIKEDMRCILGRTLDSERYIKLFENMLEKVENFEPEVIVWYLGQDLHELEYAEMKLSSDEIGRMIEMVCNLAENRKLIIILASGSRSDVFKMILEKTAKILSGK